MISNHRSLPRRLLIVTAYVIVFWGLLPALLLAAGFRIDAICVLSPVAGPVATWLGACLVLFGCVIMISTMLQLWTHGKGLPISHLPPTEFVAGGWYRRWRHPIYIGYSMTFAGASLLIGSPGSLAVGTPLLWIGWTVYALYYEEPILIRRYGERYLRYREHTPLWLPRIGRSGGSPDA